MACKQCELSRRKGTVITVCGARKSQLVGGAVVEVEHAPSVVECNCGDLQDIEEISQSELLSELTDIDNEEAE